MSWVCLRGCFRERPTSSGWLRRLPLTSMRMATIDVLRPGENGKVVGAEKLSWSWAPSPPALGHLPTCCAGLRAQPDPHLQHLWVSSLQDLGSQLHVAVPLPCVCNSHPLVSQATGACNTRIHGGSSPLLRVGQSLREPSLVLPLLSVFSRQLTIPDMMRVLCIQQFQWGVQETVTRKKIHVCSRQMQSFSRVFDPWWFSVWGSLWVWKANV